MVIIGHFFNRFFIASLGFGGIWHYGDKVGRKTTLVIALLTMGISTVSIGFLPSYTSIGIAAPLLLMLCRFGQGVGLGGEWGGAVLLAIENAPPNKRAWYGMFPQLGAPIGLLLSGGTFLILTDTMSPQDFLDYGWRIPFISSSLLVVLGFYIRLKITETPAFENVKKEKEEVKIPFFTLVKFYKNQLIFGTFAAITTFLVFYLMTVFPLSWATSDLGYSKRDFLLMQLFSVLFFALFIPVSALVADRIGRRKMLVCTTIAIALFGFVFSFFLNSGSPFLVTLFLCVGMILMGFTYGPLGTFLSELFPTNVRYSGTSLAFNMAGIIGAAFAPMIAIWLATHYGLTYVGFYLTAAACISLFSLLMISKEEHKF
ncbi:MFS transporter [Flavobacterium sp. PL002]|uniref:MFS transporter n=1 Tax=Flavobacterium sp. PL002 TaxID=1897058 RepID=UPI00351C1D6F